MQGDIDTRALELASGADAVVKQHLIECRDRYLALDTKLDAINKLLFRGLVSLVSLLGGAIVYVALHGSAPLFH